MNNQTKGKKETAPSKGYDAAKGKKGGKGKKWYSTHKSTTNNDFDWFQEWAPRPEKDKVNVVAAQCHRRPSIVIAIHGGFLFTTASNG